MCASSFILYYMYIQHIHLISVTLLQNEQNRKHMEQRQTHFSVLFCRIYDIYLINTGNKLMVDIFVLLFFTKVPSIKYLRWNKPIFFIPGLPCMYFEKKIVSLKQ